VLRHRKFRRYFRESFAKISAVNIESFRNFATIFKIWAKTVISKFGQNENFVEHSKCNFSTNLGGGREIGKEGG